MSWIIPRMWEGGECWIIGGGPSIATQFEVPEDVITGVLSKTLPVSAYSPFLSAIHGRHVIGVNVAFMLGNWIDIVFFGDAGFYKQYQKQMNAFPKVKVTCNPILFNKKNMHIQSVKLVRKDAAHGYGISQNKNSVAWNNNSGAAAINLAVHLGVARIFLLGFDMTLGLEGSQHFHDQYNRGKYINGRKLPFRRHLMSFPNIAKDAKRLGVEIINVSPDSAITEFPRVSLKEALKMK